MKKCSYCGLENEDSAVECLQCARDEFIIRNEEGKIVTPPPLPPKAVPPEVIDFGARLKAATPKTWVTMTLVTLNVAVFVILLIVQNGGLSPTPLVLTQWGANSGPLTVNGNQWWRLLACCFLHASILHLVLNMYVLVQVGKLTEMLFGNWFFLLIYLGCGITASLTSLWFHPMTPSVGASGAIFGICGALVGYLLREHRGLPRAVVGPVWHSLAIFFLVNFAFNVQAFGVDAYGRISAGHIDVAAHCGGLVSGLVFGFFGARPLELQQRQAATYNRGVALALAIGLLATLLLLLVIHI